MWMHAQLVEIFESATTVAGIAIAPNARARRERIGL
jgi:hypothetical protein